MVNELSQTIKRREGTRKLRKAAWTCQESVAEEEYRIDGKTYSS
jgi:hypothetical protein